MTMNFLPELQWLRGFDSLDKVFAEVEGVKFLLATIIAPFLDVDIVVQGTS